VRPSPSHASYSLSHFADGQDSFITEVVTLPSTFEQLRTTSAGDALRALVEHLSAHCTNPAIVNALL